MKITPYVGQAKPDHIKRLNVQLPNAQHTSLIITKVQILRRLWGFF